MLQTINDTSIKINTQPDTYFTLNVSPSINVVKPVIRNHAIQV